MNPTSLQQSAIEEINRAQLVLFMRSHWHQGEHVALIGPTGSGKTTLSHDLLDIRTYVVVIAVKRVDETLDRFRQGGTPNQRRDGFNYTKYKVIKKWPPDYGMNRVVLWVKPNNLHDLHSQAIRLHNALEDIYLAGGWTVFIDDAGYVAGYLHMGSEIGILLNQARSSHLSLMIAMTQPKSMVARMPSESFKQCRHQFVFKYDNQDEIKAIAAITGIEWKSMLYYIEMLGPHDFLYKGKGKIYLVRNR